MIAATRFLVSGRVQGVGYRAFARREALRLGLVGAATNLRDGRVEVVAIGPAERIDQLAEGLRKGPAFARVTELSRTEISVENDRFNTFETR